MFREIYGADDIEILPEAGGKTNIDEFIKNQQKYNQLYILNLLIFRWLFNICTCAKSVGGGSCGGALGNINNNKNSYILTRSYKYYLLLCLGPRKDAHGFQKLPICMAKVK